MHFFTFKLQLQIQSKSKFMVKALTWDSLTKIQFSGLSSRWQQPQLMTHQRLHPITVNQFGICIAVKDLLVGMSHSAEVVNVTLPIMPCIKQRCFCYIADRHWLTGLTRKMRNALYNATQQHHNYIIQNDLLNQHLSKTTKTKNWTSWTFVAGLMY